MLALAHICVAPKFVLILAMLALAHICVLPKLAVRLAMLALAHICVAPKLACSADMFVAPVDILVLAAVMFAVTLPNQVTITPEKLALLPNADPISNRVSRATEAPLVNVLSCVST